MFLNIQYSLITSSLFLQLLSQIFRLLEVGRLSLNVGGTIPWAEVLDSVSIESELSKSIHCYPLLDCGYNVTY